MYLLLKAFFLALILAPAIPALSQDSRQASYRKRVVMDGKLPVGSDYSSFALEVTLKNANKEEAKNPLSSYLKEALTIEVKTESGEWYPLAHKTDSSGGDYLDSVSWNAAKIRNYLPGDSQYPSDLTYIDFILEIADTKDTLKRLAGLKEGLKMRVDWDGMGESALAVQIEKDDRVAFGRPDAIETSGVYYGIKVEWKKPKSIFYTKNGVDKEEDPAAPPSEVYVAVFEADELSVPSLSLFDTESEPSECVLTLLEDEEKPGCQLACGGKAAPDFDKLSEEAMIFSTKEDSATFIDLEPDLSYAVLVSYKGSLDWQCLLAQPGFNYSLTELNGGEAAKKGDVRCFIATAAYDSPYHHKIDALRRFRDHFLMSYSLGRSFVSFYYETSPYFARKIEKSEFLKSAARVFLSPLIAISEWLYPEKED